MPKSLEDQVSESISEVRGVRNAAISDLRKFWSSDADQQAIKAIKSNDSQFEGWAQRGRDGLIAGRAPGRNGWNGWIRGGREFMRGTREIHAIGAASTLANIRATGRGVAKDVKDLPKKAARAAQRAAREVGKTAGSLITPLVLPLGIIVAVGGIGAILWFRFRAK